MASDGQTELQDWRQRTRVILTPIAAPSILGLYGFAIATFMVAGALAWGFGDQAPGVPPADAYLAPFALAVGGIAQFTAGIMAYRARDGVATAMHGIWGAFWIGFGLLWILFVTGAMPNPETAGSPFGPTGPGEFPSFAYWFVGLAAATFMGAWAAAYDNWGVFATLLTLATGAAVLAAGLFTQGDGLDTAAGYILVASAVCAWYTASAMMLEEAAGKVVLPLGKVGKPESNKPGAKISEPIEFERAMPGVRQGQ